MRVRRAPLLALGLACACRSATATVVAPAEPSQVWDYLAAKYDANGDGRVTATEYERGGGGFERLDVDGDGALTTADFRDERWSRDLTIRDMPAEERAFFGACLAARAVVLAYFQPDSAGNELTRAALDAGFARLDRDGSGALDADEFASATRALPWGGPGDAWEILLAATDAPPMPPPSMPTQPGSAPEERPAPDGLITRAELAQYHSAFASDDGILHGPPGFVPRPEGRDFASDGPPVGTLAPDFDLAPPQGGARARLSAWRGEKPVALIFGSFT